MNVRLFGRAKERIVAVADIGSASAGFAVAALSKGNPARVLAASRAMLPPEERKESAVVAGIGEMLLEAGRKTLAAYAEKSPGAPAFEALYVIVHAPWTRARSVRASATYQEETRVTSGIISNLAKEALLSETGFDRKNFLEASVARIEINGYPTNEPEGKWAHEVAVSGLVSDCDPSLRNAVAASVGQLVPHLSPRYRSSTHALLSALEGGMSERKYVIADVMNLGTAITVVSEGMADEQFFVPEGVHTMLKRLSEKGMPEETLSLMRMLERDHCESEACDALKTSIGRAEPELVRVYGEALGKMAATRRLPNRFVLATHEDVSSWLARFFSRIDFTQFTETAQPFIVRELTPKDLRASVVADHPSELDTALAVACALVFREQST